MGKPCSVLRFDMLLKVPRFSKASRNPHGWHLPSLQLLPSALTQGFTEPHHIVDCLLCHRDLAFHGLMGFVIAGALQKEPIQPPLWDKTMLPRISVINREGVVSPCSSSQQDQCAEVQRNRHAYMQRCTQAAYQGFHWRDRRCCLSAACLWGWDTAGRLTGLRNSTQYPNAIVLWGKCWSHCERTVLLPSPSSSWIHPRKASPQDMPPVAGRC